MWSGCTGFYLLHHHAAFLHPFYLIFLFFYLIFFAFFLFWQFIFKHNSTSIEREHTNNKVLFIHMFVVKTQHRHFILWNLVSHDAGLIVLTLRV